MSAPLRPAPRYILAFDLGTGTAKAALVAADGRIAGSAQRPIETVHLPGGGAEQDPEGWWSAVVAAGREALSRSRVEPDSVVAVRCTSQWAVTVAVDAEGRALSPALSWMDTRGGPYVRALVGGPLRIGGYEVRKLARWLRRTGGAPVRSGIDSLGHILYLRHERPAVYAAARAFLEPMDFLNLRLSGRIAASYGTIYPYWLTDNRDPAAISYDPVLVRWTGIDPGKLPELIAPGETVGPLSAGAARELGLRPGTKVLAGLSDSQAATVGAGIVEPGRGYFSLGTTAWLSCLVERQRTNVRRQLATMPAGLPGQRMVVAEQGAAGRCLEFLRHNVLAGDGRAVPFEQLEREASAVRPGSDGLLFTPWLGGVNTPLEDPDTRSAFFNQTLRTTRGHYVRAVMEGVAYNLRWLRPHVERFARSRFESLVAIGGGTLSPTWCQTFADVLGCPIQRLAEPRHATAAGAALAGFAALDELEPAAIPAAVRIAATHEPDRGATRVHDRQFKRFLELYRHNRRIYRRLNREAPVEEPAGAGGSVRGG